MKKWMTGLCGVISLAAGCAESPCDERALDLMEYYSNDSRLTELGGLSGVVSECGGDRALGDALLDADSLPSVDEPTALADIARRFSGRWEDACVAGESALDAAQNGGPGAGATLFEACDLERFGHVDAVELPSNVPVGTVIAYALAADRLAHPEHDSELVTNYVRWMLAYETPSQGPVELSFDSGEAGTLRWAGVLLGGEAESERSTRAVLAGLGGEFSILCITGSRMHECESRFRFDVDQPADGELHRYLTGRFGEPDAEYVAGIGDDQRRLRWDEQNFAVVASGPVDAPHEYIERLTVTYLGERYELPSPEAPDSFGGFALGSTLASAADAWRRGRLVGVPGTFVATCNARSEPPCEIDAVRFQSYEDGTPIYAALGPAESQSSVEATYTHGALQLRRRLVDDRVDITAEAAPYVEQGRSNGPRVEIRGRLSEEAVQAVAESGNAGIQACFGAHGPSGDTLEMRITISPDGSVRYVHAADSSQAPALAACIVGQIEVWTFPPPEGGGLARVVYWPELGN